MGFLSNLLETAVLGVRTVTGQRDFDAAKPSRLVSGWNRSNQILDRQLRMGLTALRERARDLIHNSAYGAKFIRLNRINIIGPYGVKLQVKVQEPGAGGAMIEDSQARQKLETAFAAWGQAATCTVTGKHTFADVQQLVVTHWKSDGEAIARKRWNVPGNPFGFALQIIDPALLDEQWERQGSAGENQIRLGVEYDQDDKPVAYWFKKRTLYADIVERERVPASEIIHFFDPLRTGQSRGIPPLAAVMLDTKMLNAYEEAEVTAARAAASKMGFIETPTGDEYTGAADSETGGRSMDMSPGTLEELAAGQKFTPFDPQHPVAAFAAFVKAVQRKIAAGISIAYHALTGDLEGVNYSSIRAGLVEDRESYKLDQQFFIRHFLNPVFKEWLAAAMLKGAVKLPMTKFDKFNVPQWRPRRWSWVDPLKDIQASMLAIKSGFKSHTETLLDEGRDIEEVWTELAAEKALADKLGLNLATFTPEAVPVVASQDKEEANGATAEAQGKE
jgi:lambda family phage portal protein